MRAFCEHLSAPLLYLFIRAHFMTLFIRQLNALLFFSHSRRRRRRHRSFVSSSKMMLRERHTNAEKASAANTKTTNNKIAATKHKTSLEDGPTRPKRAALGDITEVC